MACSHTACAQTDIWLLFAARCEEKPSSSFILCFPSISMDGAAPQKISLSDPRENDDCSIVSVGGVARIPFNCAKVYQYRKRADRHRIQQTLMMVLWSFAICTIKQICIFAKQSSDAIIWFRFPCKHFQLKSEPYIKITESILFMANHWIHYVVWMSSLTIECEEDQDILPI